MICAKTQALISCIDSLYVCFSDETKQLILSISCCIKKLEKVPREARIPPAGVLS